MGGLVAEDETAALHDLDEARARRLEAWSKRQAWMDDVWRLVVYIDRYLPQLDFRTIVGSGNEQTLVWRRQPGGEISKPSDDELEGLSFRETFANGIPDRFRPCTESEALQARLTSAGKLHSSRQWSRATIEPDTSSEPTPGALRIRTIGLQSPHRPTKITVSSSGRRLERQVIADSYHRVAESVHVLQGGPRVYETRPQRQAAVHHRGTGHVRGLLQETP